MRRTDREVTDLEKIEEILKKARVVHLGLVDDDAPYVVPMHYGYELEGGRLTLYMHCAGEGRKLDLIRANPKAFIEIETDWMPFSGGEVACRYGASYSSVMGSGRAEIVTDADEKVRGLKILMQTQTGREFQITHEQAEHVAVIRVDVDAFTAKSKPVAEHAAVTEREERRRLADMDNRELFCVAAGDRGPIAQEYLRGIIREYRTRYGNDADLQTMVQTILESEE